MKRAFILLAPPSPTWFQIDFPKCHGWREHTQIARSIFEDEALQNKIWDCAEQAEEKKILVTDYLRESEGLNDVEMLCLPGSLQTQRQRTMGRALGDGCCGSARPRQI